MNTRTIWPLAKETFKEWQEDNALRLGAALSYYTIFSLAPLLIIIIGIVSIVFGNDVARTRIMEQMQGLIGEQSAAAIGDLLKSQEEKTSTGIFATLVGVITLLVGATGVVGELQKSLSTIWEAPEPKGGLVALIRERILSLAMILGIGFLLLVSLLLSAALTALGDSWGTAKILESINFVISLAVITVLFAAMFKFLPNVKIPWRNVWIGAAFTAILFTIGKTLTGLYLSKSAVASGFGAAGSLVIILVWVYYNSQILFLGAEFTQVYSKSRARINDEEIEGEILEADTMNNVEKGVDNKSPLYKVAYKAGYQSAKADELENKLESKWKLVKWGYRVVDFLGFRRSAKLGWKGYKAKKKIDKVTQKIKAEPPEQDRVHKSR